MSHARWNHLRERKLAEGYTETDDVTEARREIRLSMALAQAVDDRRTELGLTQNELAERAGPTQAKVSHIEGSDTATARQARASPGRHPEHRPRRGGYPGELHQPPHRRRLN